MAPGQVHIKVQHKDQQSFEGPITKFEENKGYQIGRPYFHCKVYKNSKKDQCNLKECLKGVGGMNWSCEACDTTQTMQNGIMAWKFGHYCNEDDACSSVRAEVVSNNSPVDYTSRTFLLHKACAFAFRDYRRKDKSDFPRTKDTFTPLSIDLLSPQCTVILKVEFRAAKGDDCDRPHCGRSLLQGRVRGRYVGHADFRRLGSQPLQTVVHAERAQHLQTARGRDSSSAADALQFEGQEEVETVRKFLRLCAL